MKYKEFSQLKQSVRDLSSKQKLDLEHCLLHPDAQPKVVKILEQVLDGCPHCLHDGPTNGVYLKGVKGTAANLAARPTMPLLDQLSCNLLREPKCWEHYCETMVDSKITS